MASQPKSLLGSNTQAIWVLLVYHIQINMDLVQLFKFKNNKTISKYHNIPCNYKKLHKKNMKEQKYSHMQSLIFVFFNAKDVFNY